MSDTANWSYTNEATVWPVIEQTGNGWDDIDNSQEYGPPFKIKCTFASGNKQLTDKYALEQVPDLIVWHEDDRVKYGDRIAVGAGATFENSLVITNNKFYDMSFFGETMDYITVCNNGAKGL